MWAILQGLLTPHDRTSGQGPIALFLSALAKARIIARGQRGVLGYLGRHPPAIGGWRSVRPAVEDPRGDATGAAVRHGEFAMSERAAQGHSNCTLTRKR